MKRRQRFRNLIAEYARNGDGVTAPIVALLIVALVGMGGFAIDIGHVLWVQRQLQASTDAAALAGATEVASSPAAGIALAQSYSSLRGDKNNDPRIAATMVGGYPMAKCFASVAFPACSAASGTYNGIVVSERAVVPMWFAQIVGIPSLTVQVTSTASAKGGASMALDVMIVLDSTESMSSPDPNCSIPGASRETCALNGVQALLTGLNPAIDKVGLMVFPGLASPSDTQYDDSCGKQISRPMIAAYNRSPVYAIVGLSNDFKTGAGSQTLNSASDVVIAADGGNCGGRGGITALGGVGTYYADAIAAAQSALESDGDTNSQKVIVLLSDGDANATAPNMPPGKAVDQCQEAVAAARAATAQGTWVYALAYGAPGTTGGQTGTRSCTTDTTNYPSVGMAGLSACQSLENIASDPTKFFSDGSAAGGGAKSQCIGSAGDVSDLIALFKNVSASLTQPRLLPNDTT
ncbi:MAG TPA: TadE/TadG family type IV pilus assembly protein [Rhizomicrobium sp.]|nr:TadE/TadG family type IV pilus assembly protein [Rhizomicrobium sp.]